MLTGWAVYIYRHILSVVNGVSSTKASLQATVELGSGSIQDLKFVEDGTLMLLWKSKGMFLLRLRLPLFARSSGLTTPSITPGQHPLPPQQARQG